MFSMEDSRDNLWRVIHSPPMSGPLNMALDEAILEAVVDRISPKTLRLYSWEPPCLSIGYAQPLSDVDMDALRRFGWDVVRRPTGGRALLHIDELTYSISGLASHSDLSGGVLASYRNLSRGLLAGLSLLGLEPEVQPQEETPEEGRENPVCFEVPSSYEITIGSRKVIGSAQVRHHGGVLQHGSFPLRGEIDRVCRVLSFPDAGSQTAAAGRLRARAASAEEFLESPLQWDQAAEAIVSGFSQALGWNLEPAEAAPQELARAHELLRDRYQNRTWTERV